MKFKNGFTLSEVLITLGIIGVVAAITLTSLIKNYQKTVWTNQLRKSVSMFSQGFKKWMADEGVDSLGNTEAFITYVDIYSKSVYPEMGYTMYRVVGVFNAMKKYFKITYIGPIGDYSYKWLGYNVPKTINGNHAVILADGTMFFNYNFNTIDGQGYSVQLYLDVNGKKGPNILGRDVFIIWFNEAGLVTKHSFFTAKKCCNPSEAVDANGYGCVEKIMSDGWKMNY